MTRLIYFVAGMLVGLFSLAYANGIRLGEGDTQRWVVSAGGPGESRFWRLTPGQQLMERIIAAGWTDDNRGTPLRLDKQGRVYANCGNGPLPAVK